MSNKHLLEAISTLVGFVIGAGILGIPYVVAKAGFITGIINILIIGLAILILNLYVGEIVLRTKGSHQLTGYAEKYLGKTGRILMTFAMLFGFYGALVAYIIKEGEFLATILAPIFGGNYLLYSALAFTIMSLFVYLGLKAIEKCEFFMVVFIVLIIAILFIIIMPKINYTNLTEFSSAKLFIPYGVVLFAFIGAGAIPEMREELKQHKHLIKKAIIMGSLIPLVIYLIFAFLIVGVTGNNTTDGSIIGLGDILGSKILILGIIFGVFTMATSFLAVGLALKEMYQFDFKISKFNASTLTCFVPLAIAIIIIISKIEHAFFNVLDLTGAIAGSLISILIVLMFWRAKKLGNRKPEYSTHKNKVISLILILMFIAGILYKFLSF